ncbi:uncharacterized protein LOC128133398 [Lactuca sativa]|uniref:uncharacterized protein LOC128133398 n=1 Tax=Lactuca sativa TaxID=4236 RepID=UPI0022B03B3D|nr:uncharacterized protein LOC128133398 [Lactuca sativa]
MSFDDNYVKKLTSSKEPMDEIFPQTGQVTIPISNLFEEYVKLFDEPESAILSETKAADNEVDNLKKIIDEAAKVMESKPSSSGGPQVSAISQRRVNFPILLSRGRIYQPPYPMKRPIEGENFVPKAETGSSFEGENAIQDELNEFERNKVWRLIPTPKDASVVGLKWVFRNKMDKEGNVIRNKARVVVKGYCKEEGINYKETVAPVARLESVHIFLGYNVDDDFGGVEVWSTNSEDEEVRKPTHGRALLVKEENVAESV